MISSRYALPVVVLLTLALVPTVIHSYIKAKVDDGKTASQVTAALKTFSSRPYTRHDDEWVNYMYGSNDWMERIYQLPNGNKARLFVARSYDHKKLYHHPELALSHGSNLEKEGVVLLSGKQQIPVHLLSESNGSGFVAYVLHYDGRYVQDPLEHQVREALKLLVSARSPMTLFYIHDSSTLVKDEFSKTTAAELLKTALNSFEEAD